MAGNIISRLLKYPSVRNSLKSSIKFWFLAVSIVPFLTAIFFSMNYIESTLDTQLIERLEKSHNGIEIEMDIMVEYLMDYGNRNSGGNNGAIESDIGIIVEALEDKSKAGKALIQTATDYLLELENIDELAVYDYWSGKQLAFSRNKYLIPSKRAFLNLNNGIQTKTETAFSLLSPTSAHAQDLFDIDEVDSSDEEDDYPSPAGGDESELLPPDILQRIKDEKLSVYLHKSIDPRFGLRIDSINVVRNAFMRPTGIVRSSIYIDKRFCDNIKRKTGIDLMIISKSPSMTLSSIATDEIGGIDLSGVYDSISTEKHTSGEMLIGGGVYKSMVAPIEPFEDEINMFEAGFVLLLLNTDYIASVKNMTYSFAIIGALMLIVVIPLSLYIIRLIITPINNVVDKLKEISMGQGDLSERIVISSNNEIGMLAMWFNKFVENLQEIVTSINGVSITLSEVSHDIVDKTKKVTRSTSSQISSVASTVSAIEEMNISTKGIADAVNELSTSAENSSSAVLETDASVKELAKNSAILSTSVESAAMSINQMAASIKQVSDHSGVLSMITNDTEDSMQQIDRAISRIEDNASQTVKLSEQSIKDATAGMNSVNETIKGINLIKDSVGRAGAVIQSLGSKISSIDDILEVIDNVAEQTNLLALNAAIIAAQSGEHGKGFAIVADEIKELADRTAASTKEIANIIMSVQKESNNAIDVMRVSFENVTKSVDLSVGSGEMLKKIHKNTEQSTVRVKSIAESTVIQSKKTTEVMKSMNEVATMVKQISSATKEQNVGSTMILKATESIKGIAYQLKSAVREQTLASQNISTETLNISQMVKQIIKAVKIQQEQSDSVLSDIRIINENAQDNRRIIDNLDSVVETLGNKSDVLNREIGKFKV